MPLTNVKLLPGFDKTDTPSGAEGRWIDGDFVRFRYAQPEKIGGFAAIGQKLLQVLHVLNILGLIFKVENMQLLEHQKVLLIYYEDAFYDVTPLETGLTGATFTSVNGQSTVTINKTAHGLVSGDYFLFESVTLPGGGATSFTTANFTDQTFEVITAAADSFTITMASMKQEQV